MIDKLIAWFKARGGDAWKVHGGPYQRKGEPDIDGWLPQVMIKVAKALSPLGNIQRDLIMDVALPLHFKIEAKNPGEKPDLLQAKRIADYKAAGYIAGYVTSVEELENLYKEWLNG